MSSVSVVHKFIVTINLFLLVISVDLENIQKGGLTHRALKSFECRDELTYRKPVWPILVKVTRNIIV